MTGQAEAVEPAAIPPKKIWLSKTKQTLAVELSQALLREIWRLRLEAG